MSVVSLTLPGSVGLVVDMPPAEIPANAWSEALNVRFRNGGCEIMGADVELLPVPGGLTPLWALEAYSAISGAATWVIGLGELIYAYQNGTLTNITPSGAVSSGLGNATQWSGGVLGSYTLVNDGIRAPWGWPVPEPTTKMVNLPNWPSGVRCATLRTFKQYGLALDVTKSGTRYPTMVKWSHVADNGSAPPSWDETDPTMDAGEYELSETPGAVVDCLPLKDINIVYKRDSVWGMQYIGGVYIFRFFKIFGDWGLPHRNCVVEYSSGKHCVFTGSDLVVHDGNSYKSVVAGKIRTLLRSFSNEQLDTSYLVYHRKFDEVWLCWRKDASTGGADTALVYNVVDETCTLRALPGFYYIAAGIIDPEASSERTWAGATGTWETDNVAWDDGNLVPGEKRLLGLGDGWLHWVEGSPQALTPFRLVREYAGVPIKSGQAPDMTTTKFLRRIWPRITGDAGAVLNVTYGKADSVAETTRWGTPKAFTVGTTVKHDLTMTGKMLALKFEDNFPPDNLPQNLRFSGADLDLDAAGEW